MGAKALCEKCGRRPATVHLTAVEKGRARETHWCEVCAQDVDLAGFPIPLRDPEAQPVAARPEVCTACGHANPPDWNFCSACGLMREP